MTSEDKQSQKLQIEALPDDTKKAIAEEYYGARHGQRVFVLERYGVKSSKTVRRWADKFGIPRTGQIRHYHDGEEVPGPEIIRRYACALCQGDGDWLDAVCPQCQGGGDLLVIVE